MTKLGKRKCKECGITFQKTKPLQFVCSVECSISYARKKEKEKREKKQKAKDRATKQKLKTYSQKVQEARRIFQQYIRLRDKDQSCICCGASESKAWDAGHFYKAELYSGLIFNEDNCHKQRRYCNRYLGGNEREYRVGLIDRIGLEKVEAIEAAKDSLKYYKYTDDELNGIKKKYRKKIKELKQCL